KLEFAPALQSTVITSSNLFSSEPNSVTALTELLNPAEDAAANALRSGEGVRMAKDPSATDAPEKAGDCELTVLMPCLNESETLAVCIRKALASIESLGVSGEVLIADNGSTDGRSEERREGKGNRTRGT